MEPTEASLTLYDCGEIFRIMDQYADPETGEISEAGMAAIVAAQTASLTHLSKLVNAISFLEHFQDVCKAEENRIKCRRQIAENRVESIKKYLMPYVRSEVERTGHPLTVGTHTLSTRKSEAVELSDLFTNDSQNRKLWCVEKTTYAPDKKKIGEALEKGESISGASLKQNVSLQIK